MGGITHMYIIMLRSNRGSRYGIDSVVAAFLFVEKALHRYLIKMS